MVKCAAGKKAGCVARVSSVRCGRQIEKCRVCRGQL